MSLFFWETGRDMWWMCAFQRVVVRKLIETAARGTCWGGCSIIHRKKVSEFHGPRRYGTMTCCARESRFKKSWLRGCGTPRGPWANELMVLREDLKPLSYGASNKTRVNAIEVGLWLAERPLGQSLAPCSSTLSNYLMKNLKGHGLGIKP